MELVKFIPILCVLLGLIITITGASAEECICGRKSPKRIIGGNKAGISQWPSMAGIYDTSTNTITCGGVVITDKHVLTAAHCIIKFKEKLNLLRIVSGNNKADKDDGADSTMLYEVKEIVTHPDFQPLFYNYDLGLVKTTENIVLPGGGSPVCLPFMYKDKDMWGSVVTAVGWDTGDSKQKLPNTVDAVDMFIVDKEECLKHDSDLEEFGMMCSNRRTRSPCQGDIGGPLFYRNISTANLITLAVMSEPGCGLRPTINTDIADFLDFIESNTPGYEYCKVY